MRLIISTFFLALVFVSCGTRKTTASSNILTPKSEDSTKWASTYANSITAEELKKHLEVIASDEYEGRETAKRGQKLAAEYLEKYYKTIGINGGMRDGSYQQSFPLKLKDPRNVRINIRPKGTGPEKRIDLKFIRNYYYFGGFDDTTFSKKEIVFCGYGIEEDDYTNYTKEVAGKVVVVYDGTPEGVNLSKDWDNWRLKLKTAKAKGAVAFFTVKDNYSESAERIKDYIDNPQLQLHNKGKERKTGNIPNFYTSWEVVEVMFGKKEAEIKEAISDNKVLSSEQELELNVFVNDNIVYSENVLGFIEGTDKKEEVLVISAHYDHIGYDNGEICNGADDDGSGTVAVLELAQAFKLADEAGSGPRRSILFLNVSGEEKGLLGSQYYAENPVYSLENTITNLNIDMIGRIDENHDNGNYIYVIGADKLSKDLHDINEASNKEYTNLELDYTYNDENDPNRFYYRSDHYNFAKNNIPVIFYFSGVHEDYHKPTDDVEKIMFPKMEKVVKLIFYTAWELANRENRPTLK